MKNNEIVHLEPINVDMSREDIIGFGGEVMRVRITFLEEILGTSPNNRELMSEYIASKAPIIDLTEEEVEAVEVEDEFEKSMTVFPRNKDGEPTIYSYQWKGFFKDACQSLRKLKNTKSSKIKAYKKEIDGLVFILQRHIVIHTAGEGTILQRPLRASTPMGERIALAASETYPAGSWVEFDIGYLDPSYRAVIIEWLNYGKMRGYGQWRNSGKGRFVWEEVKE